MIFNVPGHIDFIRNGLSLIDVNEPCKPCLIKTETRRTSRGLYQVEAERKKPHKIGYAVQQKRGVKAEQDIRIVIDKIWEEKAPSIFDKKGRKRHGQMIISRKSAWNEGGYSPQEYEELWTKLNPKWDGWSRWVFEFHVVKEKRK